LSEQRYEPLPSIDRLPAWLWRRTSTTAKIITLVALAATLVLAAILIPRIRAEQHERAAADARDRAAAHARTVEALKREQRPRTGRSHQTAAPAQVRDLERAIASDARARGLAGPILHGSCEPFPRTVGEPPPERDPTKTSGSYSCVAVTSVIDASEASSGGELGHLYRAALDFRTGRYALCRSPGGPIRSPIRR
jgi:hypothetical protein